MTTTAAGGNDDDNHSVAQQECVRVIVRVRPRNERERKGQKEIDDVVTITSKHSSDDLPNHVQVASAAWDVDVGYTYDAVFGTLTQQDEIYGYLASSVEQVVQGFNCTIFAYGQTGTGKTHTMMGPDSMPALVDGNTIAAEAGIIPRAVAGLFAELATIGASGAGAVVHCSYMQIYNNQVFDLLQATNVRDQKPLQVRENIKGNAKHIYVSGISEFRVGSAQDVLDLLQVGGQNRTIRATECNEKSSRSHALLQVNIEVESRGSESTTIIRRAKLNLVDLAGSEKWDTDIAMSNDRTRELRNINASLSALGNVIAALTDKKRTHIPYRDSKLTRLLQDSLGGNTRTIVIATISPSEAAIEETISTLQFAERAKQISLNIQKEIARLQHLLRAQPTTERFAALEAQVASLTDELKQARLENAQLKRKLQANKIDPRPPPSLVSSNNQVPEATPVLERPTSQASDSAPTDARAVEEYDRQAQHQLSQLHRLQSERRQLEAQLQSMQAPSLPVAPEDDDVCPICQRLIDHHTDDELDRCIELEAQAIAPEPVRPKTSVSTSSLPALRRPSSKASLTQRKESSPYAEPPGSLSSRESTKSPSTPPTMTNQARPAKPKSKHSIVKQMRARQKAKDRLAASPYVDVLPKKLLEPVPPLNQKEGALANDVRDIGLNLTVYSYRYDSWYPCTIVGYDSKRKMHCCHYDYGDKQWLVLADKKIEVVGRTTD
ncbi:hypothetical protein SPRG_00223 [Saprolegnia parasitica CBS 223.65]|uniref:Kinesin-like protein n=1 Tax=Saprolegnia parasitica (strain CBS 223.65) TaxID=695850 RepID=A0A067CXE3_SAPPC|nr:hypothetical protein SPRG_00223 [Saprolegnia parasitica CBS 223.65]KDO35374.1 hypothetical protein SPRG_00223 [Saprolegnia parasitica CBS 223.65]|eukprot:XP_012193719.1 hypothetical protein SPRG_00223 [Saprolegnia parasitica CBS 223.65]